MPLSAALEALEGEQGESNMQEGEIKSSSKRAKETTENSTLLPSPTIRGPAAHNQSTALPLNPMHILSAQGTSPHTPSGPLSSLSALLSPLGFTLRDEPPPTLSSSAATSFKSRDSKAENNGLRSMELLSRAEAIAFSPNPRNDVRAPVVHMRERSMSSCGLLELIVDEGDDET